MKPPHLISESSQNHLVLPTPSHYQKNTLHCRHHCCRLLQSTDDLGLSTQAEERHRDDYHYSQSGL